VLVPLAIGRFVLVSHVTTFAAMWFAISDNGPEDASRAIILSGLRAAVTRFG
jgi:hypothetical protein